MFQADDKKRSKLEKIKFLTLWISIVPVCTTAIGLTLWLTRINWIPTTNIWISIVIYLVYWVLLGFFQGALLVKFKHKKIGYKWFLSTSITGFLVMIFHDLSPLVMGVDTGGQGILYLILSLPVVAVLGGLILGYSQFLIIKDYHNTVPSTTPALPKWLGVSFVSWSISFAGTLLVIINNIILSGSNMLFVILIFATIGTAIKGYAVMKYLQL
jgi:hypothetical protein